MTFGTLLCGGEAPGDAPPELVRDDEPEDPLSTASITGRSIALRLAHFVGHYLQMVAAMVVGMVVLAPVWPAAWTARADVGAVVMALDMTVAMVVWMAIRRHSWPRIAEMSAAMVLPFAVLLVPYWLGALSATGLMIAAHVIMFPLMLAAMLWRHSDYGL